MNAAAVERDPVYGCASCTRLHEHLVDEGGDLVCAPGHGCAVRMPKRHAPVQHSTVRTAATTTPAARPVDTCACGHTHATLGAVWQELRGRVLVALCPGCAPGGPCR